MEERSPGSWKKVQSPDPLLSLSNLHLDQNCSSSKKSLVQDRFMNEMSSIQKKLSFDSDHEINKEAEENQPPERVSKKEGKKNKYRLVLSNSLKSNGDWPYTSKIMRGGYVDFYTNLVPKEHCEPAVTRQFPKTAYKVLNAPRLKDDFYTTLLDWSKDDMISVVLDNAVYIWSSRGNDAEKLVEGCVSSVKWGGKGLAIGDETGRIRMLDVEKRKEVARSKNHLGRVGVLDVSVSGNEVASGSKDSEMIIWDIRQRESCLRFAGHRQEICGLKWSWDNGLLASGGNDNLVMIW